MRSLVLYGVLIAFPTTALADVSLPSIIGSHMVLQRGKPLKIWGFADNGESVGVDLAGIRAATKANRNGEWMVTLPAMEAGGPYGLIITGKNIIILTDILVGDVWIGSGQSNMEWPVAAVNNASAEVAKAKYPKMRLFLVPKVVSGIPQKNVDATWKRCDPVAVSPFSAVLYFFGQHIHTELNIPVGLIAASWGFSQIEAWTPPPGFAGVAKVSDIAEYVRSTQVDYLKRVAKQKESSTPEALSWLKRATAAAEKNALLPPAPDMPLPKHILANGTHPTSMYNAMINPLVPFGIRGVIWYQGEANISDGMLYAHKMRALIEGWRKVWGYDFSFYWSLLAPFRYGDDPEQLPRMWEAQQLATSLPGTSAVIISDIADLDDIHPRNKQDVGKRLAMVALAKDYGHDIVYRGPSYTSMEIIGNKVRLYFDHIGSGLESRDGEPLTWFEIASESGFVAASAVIEGTTVIVSSEKVDNPTGVRFSWHQLAQPNLQNKEGFQAGPFRTMSTAPNIGGKKRFCTTSMVELDCPEIAGVIRYTVDGFIPTRESKRYTKPFKLTETTTVKARFFREGGTQSTVAEAEFSRIEPRIVDGKKLIPGLVYEYYEGYWIALPDFTELKAKRTGICDDFSLSVAERQDSFAIRFSGYLEIRRKARYTFLVASDDGSKFYLDGRELADNDGRHANSMRTITVDLEPGMHKVVVSYFEISGNEFLEVRYGSDWLPAGPLQLWCEG